MRFLAALEAAAGLPESMMAEKLLLFLHQCLLLNCRKASPIQAAAVYALQDLMILHDAL